MSGGNSRSIFLSYRRADAAFVSRVYDRLVSAFGASAVFRDLNTIPAGADFGKVIGEVIPNCQVVLALIGRNWANTNDNSRATKSDEAVDWVSFELKTARDNNRQVVPVLLGDVGPPGADALPSALRWLADLNATKVRDDPDFHGDMDKLVATLVDSGLSPAAVREGPAELWPRLQNTESVRHLQAFAESFVGTQEGHAARVRAEQLSDWQGILRLGRYLEFAEDHPNLKQFARSSPREFERLVRGSLIHIDAFLRNWKDSEWTTNILDVRALVCELSAYLKGRWDSDWIDDYEFEREHFE